MTMLEETTAREYINEAVTGEKALFSVFKVWGQQQKLISQYKRSKRNLSAELSKDFNGWAVSNVMDALNIPVLEFDENQNNLGGYATNDGIAINILGDNLIRTAIHEIAHYVMGVHQEDESLNEAETETVCYLVCKYIGINDDLKYSRSYIQSNLKGRELSEESKTRCINAANQIINAGY